MSGAPAAPAPSPARGLRALCMRLAAAFYDGLLLGALLMAAAGIATLIAVLAGRGSRLDPGAIGAFSYLYRAGLLLLVWGYFALCYTRSGETLGMKAWRLRLVTLDGRAVTWRRSALRVGLAFALWMPPLVAGLTVMAHRLHPGWLAVTCLPLLASLAPLLRSGVAWHDRLSGTRIIALPREGR